MDAGNVVIADFNEQVGLHGADNPGLLLVSDLLTHNNYLSWRISMITALEAKTKLGFVDGTFDEPAANTTQHRRWKKAHSMVLAWLKTAISPELRNNFIYVSSAKDLWKELEEKYGVANSPMLFQLKRKIALTQQADLSVAQYYSCLKQYWDQIGQLRPPVKCSCDGRTTLEARESEDRLIQFLMGLSDVYDGIRDQILLLDPMPNFSKVYAMVVQAESQRRVRVDMNYAPEIAAAASNQISRSAGGIHKSGGRKFQPRRDRSGSHCTHCNKNGHEKAECFLLHGYPDWYLEMHSRRQSKSVAAAAHMVADSPRILPDTPLDNNGLEDIIAAAVQRELRRVGHPPTGGTSNVGMNPEVANLVSHTEFAGPTH